MDFLLNFGIVYLLTFFILTFGGFSFGGYGPYMVFPEDFPKANSMFGYFFRYWLPQCVVASLIIPILFILVSAIIRSF